VNIEYDDLPAAVQQVIQQKYKEHKISEIEKVDHFVKGIFYDVEFEVKGEKQDLEFNDLGELIGFEN